MTAAPDWSALAASPLGAWQPVSQVVSPRSRVPRSSHPSIDVHCHLGRWLNNGDWMFEEVDELIAVLDESNVQTVVNLDGFWGDELEANVTRYDRAYPSRIATFCWIEWARLAQDDGVEALKATLAQSARQGARGVKVWKELGLSVRGGDGRLILPDDPRVIHILGYAGELNLPVLIHIADPKAYFAPADLTNERLDELLDAPGLWAGDLSQHVAFDRLIDALATLVTSTPNTRYVGAHVGCAAEDLGRVEQLLAAAPNLWIDIAGRLSEVGRQPRRFSALIKRFPDRVVFGTDLYPSTAAKYEKYFHFLESDDEAFDYHPREPYPPHARWTISGLSLDPGQLASIYVENPKRWLGW